MGINCCHPNGAFNPDSRKLLQIKHKKNNHNKEDNEDNAISDIEMLVLDVEEEKIYTTKISLRIKESIKGMSQLNVNNNLFLCGSENESTEGAFLFRIDNTKSLNSVVSILINAQHNHVYPSMIYLPDSTIMVVGGKKQIQCELFDIDKSKWKYLPELPEERYHCSLLLDHSNKYVYLFGGFCSEKGRNCTDILRMNTESMMIWDKLLIVEGKELLAKTMCGMIRKENEDKEGKVVYILGGKNNKGEECDSIIEFDMTKRRAKKLKSELKWKAKFINQGGVNVNKDTYVLFDKKGNIHRVHLKDFTVYTNIDEDEEDEIQSI